MNEALSSLVADALGAVEATMRHALTSQVPLLRQAAHLAVSAGGKRLRPTLLLLAQRAVSQHGTSPAMTLAAAVELLHTASLVHDDINDHSDLRRGQPTVRS
jgi:geranylgeranyl pyrophosphate synthase